MTPDYLSDALPVLRAKIQRGDTRLSPSMRKRVDAVLDGFMVALDIVRYRISSDDLLATIRIDVRQCIGAIFVFELLGTPGSEDVLVRVLEQHEAACRSEIVSSSSATA